MGRPPFRSVANLSLQPTQSQPPPARPRARRRHHPYQHQEADVQTQSPTPAQALAKKRVQFWPDVNVVTFDETAEVLNARPVVRTASASVKLAPPDTTQLRQSNRTPNLRPRTLHAAVDQDTDDKQQKHKEARSKMARTRGLCLTRNLLIHESLAALTTTVSPSDRFSSKNDSDDPFFADEARPRRDLDKLKK